jgi:hypothetical protein
MAIELNTAEGQADGTTLTAANSGGGSGDPLDQVVKSGTGAVVFSNDVAMFGTQSYKITSGATSAVYLMFDTTANIMGSCQMGIYITAYPSINQIVLNMRSVSGTTGICGLDINATGVVRLTNSAGGNAGTSGAVVVPLNTWVRLDMRAEVGTTTSNGRLAASMSLHNSPTPLWSVDTGYTTNAGTAAIGNYRFGKLDTVPTMATFYVDDLTDNVGDADFISPRPLAAGAWFRA